MKKHLDNEGRSFYFIEKKEKEDFKYLAGEIMKIAVEVYKAITGAVLEERKILKAGNGQIFQGISIKRGHKEVIKALEDASNERTILRETDQGFETIQGDKIKQRIEIQEY